jgi:hypothetical protein
MTMESDEAQEIRVKMDLANLARILTSDNLNPSVMFTENRGIRSCTPTIEPALDDGAVSERLRMVQLPVE